jgi:hypothetical protein
LGFQSAVAPALGAERKVGIECHLEKSVERLRNKPWLDKTTNEP